MKEKTQAELNLEERKRVSRETLENEAAKIAEKADREGWTGSLWWKTKRIAAAALFVVELFLIGFLASANIAEDFSPERPQMTVESVSLKLETGNYMIARDMIYITTDQGIFSIHYRGYEGLLLLQPQDKVTISYAEKADNGVTPITYIRIDYSSNPDIIIHNGAKLSKETLIAVATLMGTAEIILAGNLAMHSTEERRQAKEEQEDAQ